MAANRGYVIVLATTNNGNIGQHPMPRRNLIRVRVESFILPSPIIIRRGAVITLDCDGVLGSMIGILGAVCLQHL